ncbi:MAG TPA: hypothetical protein VG986_16655 [Pseudolabrys sp.]|nr:hypothetical protein [Pseudolabrys sp.]
MFRRLWIFAALLGAGLASGQTHAQPVAERWVELGCRTVGFNVDRDVIRVGGQGGTFRAIRLRAANNAVYMLDLKVVYGNGAPDDIPVRAEIRAGGQTGALDLRGRDRVIERIEMIYRSRPSFRGQAVVCAQGLAVVAAQPAPPPAPVQIPAPIRVAPGPGWVELGCRSVGFNVDHDVINVGGRQGTFRAIRLRTRDNDIFMSNLRIVYGNGASDNIPVGMAIRAGSMSAPIDLKGDRRVIQRIEMVYRSRPNFRGQAEVCVDARE